MLKESIALPKFAAQHVAGLLCRYCNRPLLPANVLSAGIRHPTGFASDFVFAMTVRCEHCKKRTHSCVPQQPLDGTHWASQVAAATPTARATRPHQKLKAVESVGAKESRSAEDASKERSEFYAVQVSLMECTPGNYDHADGVPATILTIAKKDGTIEPLVFSMRDTKSLVRTGLITLATADDPIAQWLLGHCFSVDDDGSYRWPDEPPPEWT